MFGQLKAKYVESQLFFADIYEMVMFPGLLVPIPDREARVVEMYEKRSLECVFLAMVTWFRLFRHVLHSVNVARFHFSAVFWESCYIAHPRSCAKVSGKPVRGYEIGGKTAFRQEKCCTIRNLPQKSGSCYKIRRFLPGFLISWQVFSAWCLSWAWCSDGGARGSVACAGSADRDRGGRSPSRTVGSCATSSWSPPSVTARAPTASISRA